MAIASAILGVMGPVLLAIGAGFVLARTRPVALSGLTDALFYVFVPALVFSTMAENTLSASELGEVALAACLVTAASLLLGVTLLRALGLRSRGMLLTIVFANNANMGISICELAFGEQAMALATTYYATAAFLTVPLGLSIAAPGGGYGEALKAPLAHAALLGLAVHFLGLPVPDFVLQATRMLGTAAIPTMLLSLGCRLATLELTSVRLPAQATAARIGGGLLIGLGVVAVLKATGTARSVIILQAAMPTAVITFVLAERYRQAPDLVSSTIGLSTLTSLVTTSALLAWLME